MNKPGKLEVAGSLLEHGNIIVYLDPRREGVGLPDEYRKDTKLGLQVGLRGGYRLTLAEKGIFCTLVFPKASGECFLPWTAIFAISDLNGQGITWEDDVPVEVYEAQSKARMPKRGPERRGPFGL
jgi:stringent starvation protein B